MFYKLIVYSTNKSNYNIYIYCLHLTVLRFMRVEKVNTAYKFSMAMIDLSDWCVDFHLSSKIMNSLKRADPVGEIVYDYHTALI